LGNFKKIFKKYIGRIFTLRYQTPRRLQKQERVRGYRDHGSMATIDEVARREANSEVLNSYLVEIIRFIEETGCSIPEALRLNQMELLE
jgi:hypothetical protein